MGLNQLTNRIYFLEHDPEVDRPMLAYLKGDKFSLAVDAGYSASHVQDFYRAIEVEHFNKPDFTVITHWHYDHPLGCTPSMESVLPTTGQTGFSKTSRNRQWTPAISKS